MRGACGNVEGGNDVPMTENVWNRGSGVERIVSVDANF